jgi:uncharacterized protein YkwD
MRRRVVTAVACAAIGAGILPGRAAAQTIRLPVEEPAPETYLGEGEQDILEELNLLRADPPRYAAHLEALRDRFRDKLRIQPGRPAVRTEEGVAALDEAVAALKSSKPLPKVAPSVGMTRAARKHAEDIGESGEVGHTGRDGSGLAQRLERHGKWRDAAGEAIALGSEDPRGVVIQLLVDDGVPGRGHRKSLVREDYRVVGIACAPHKVFRQVCVIDLAAGYVSDGR